VGVDEETGGGGHRSGGTGAAVHAGRREGTVHQQQQLVGQRGRVGGAGVAGQVAEADADGLLVGEGGGVAGR
jgi:hypothetical protein